MKTVILRWVCFGLSVLVVGPIVGSIIGMIRGVDGSGHATALVSNSPVMGLVLVLLGVGVAGAAGVLAAGLAGPRDGLACMGAALAWGAWANGPFTEIVRSANGGNPLTRLAIEGLVVGLAVAAIAIVILVIGRADERDESDTPASGQSLLGLAAFVGAGAIVAWAVSRGDAMGQTYAAAASAGLFGALAARIIGNASSARTLVLAIPILSLMGPLVAQAMLASPIRESVFSGTLNGLGWITPLTWSSGILLGMPLGLSWAASMVEHHQPSGSGAAAARA